MDIFVVDVAEANNIEETLLKEFQKKEITNKKRWNQHCLSYLMLDRILKEVYKIEDREIVFNDGKPVLKNGSKYFSISHGGKYIVITFSNFNCGVDIEEIRNREYKAIVKRMRFEANSLEEFYQEWTRFEAEYKLGNNSASKRHTLQYDNHIITAVSENLAEKFELFVNKK